MMASDIGKIRKTSNVSVIGGLEAAPIRSRRRIMKALIAALALTTLIAMSTFAPTANAAPMSPGSSSFGSNGY